MGVKKEEIAEAIIVVGGGEPERIRVGPIRTLPYGTVVTWADCPARMALRAAEAAGFTLGWARVGVTLEKGGLPSATAAWHEGTSGGGTPRWWTGGAAA